MARRKSSFDKTLDALRDAARDPNHVDLAVFRRVLAARENGFLVADAARRAEQLELRTLVGDLEGALDALLNTHAKSDPGCRGKHAIVQTLTTLCAGESDLLVRACRHVQMEPSGAAIIDTAGDLRASSLRALALQMDPQVTNLAAELLTDRDAVVRAETARLLAEVSPPGAEALLRLRVTSGEEDGDVLSALFFALLRLAPARSLPFVAWFARAHDRSGTPTYGGPPVFLGFLAGAKNADVIVFAAVLALGEARPTGARALLVDLVSRAATPELVHHVMLALALLRDADATELLFGELEQSPSHRAVGALLALAIYRHDAAIAERVRAIVTRRDQREITQRYQREFRSS